METNKIKFNRNLARDKYMFRACSAKPAQKETLHNGKVINNGMVWKHRTDKQEKRRFVLPLEWLDSLKTIGFSRDVLAVVSHLYHKQGFPESREVNVSCYEICQLLGLSYGGWILEKITNSLAFLRVYTVHNYENIKKLDDQGRIREKAYITFGFIDTVERVFFKDGKDVPLKKQKLTITLNKFFTEALRIQAGCDLPASALQEVPSLPQRHQKGVRNLIYYLATRYPQKSILLSLRTIQEIAEIKTNRKDKLVPYVEKYLGYLSETIVSDFSSYKNGEGEIIFKIALD